MPLLLTGLLAEQNMQNFGSAEYKQSMHELLCVQYMCMCDQL